LVIDPRRYRYAGPSWLPRALCGMIPRADVTLVLDAPEGVILRRKQEVALEEIQRQKGAYLRWAKQSPAAAVLESSRSVSEVCGETAGVVLEALERRTMRRRLEWLGLQPSETPAAGKEVHKEGIPCEGVLREALRRFLGSDALRPHAVPGAPPASWPAMPGPEDSSAHFSAHTPRPTSLGFGNVRCFAVLPSRSSPRWLLPLGEPQCLVRGFDLYAPCTARARLLKDLLKGAIKLGWQGRPRDRIRIESPGPLALEALVTEVTGERFSVFSLSIGTPGPYRKLTICVMSPGGEILGYIKLPLTPAATGRIRHEAEVLARLWAFAALRPFVPQVLYAGEWEEGFVSFQSPGPGRPGPIRFGELHEVFMQTLRNAHRTVKPGAVLAMEVAARWRRVKPLMGARWQELADASLERARKELDRVMVPCGIVHGDFAPWNTRAAQRRLFVFDWECASWNKPALWDVFHFHAQVASLPRGRRSGFRAIALASGGDASPWGGALHQLYVLDSVCRLREEGTPLDSPGVEHRYRLLRRMARMRRRLQCA